MKVLTVVGARPQFIKAATVSRVIQNKDGVEEILVHTGQHYDQNMSDVFFDEMSIPKPNYSLNINGTSHGAMTGAMLREIEEVLLSERPDVLLVYGDTNSTLAGALAASKIHIPVAHVEAGLRSFNMKMPEEQNRILTDRVSSYLFCPTDTAIKNLEDESFRKFDNLLVNVGDVMYDAAKFYSLESASKAKLKLPDKYLLVTCHRAENTDSKQRLTEIVKALNTLSKEIDIVFPLHPRTEGRLKEFSLELEFETVAPVGYFDMLECIKNAHCVMTDSGGLQKEAYFFDKYCITMRDETEWVELVSSGVNEIVGADCARILEGFQAIQSKNTKFPTDLYGDGNAAQKIVSFLKESLEK